MPGSARGRRCRMWLDYEKRMICAQTRKPRLSVSQAGRRYDVNAKQAFNWLKDPKLAPNPKIPNQVCVFWLKSLRCPFVDVVYHVNHGPRIDGGLHVSPFIATFPSL